ncbi:DJ-1/PfpI family protein [Cupriavidus basilensis]|uniref:DJ-1/PfpI family protein n=1 Tax=Cupriavidus basilensis TaxID=68895 RepID=UPI0028464C2A|nr:DJ-1/PfpI family protein [Cupriavidus basilensis]MDR3380266.1 DJ-1/PfpI family protein [Cupriavidus basilensis]
MQKLSPMRMTILLRDGYTALDVVGGYEVLANIPGIDTEFAAPQPGLVWADTRRLALHAWRGWSEVHQTDILYVPGGPGVGPGLEDTELMATIARLHASSIWTIGICNGVEWLGKAGVIAGLEVTTNWFARDKVAAYGAKVNRERFHRDGKVITGAGVSASVDAALFLAGLLGGEALARTLQLGIEYYPQPPFGNGTPDEAPAGAQALVRRFEEDGAHRIASLRPPV